MIADYLAGSITMTNYGSANNAKNYLKYQRRFYAASVILAYFPTGPFKIDGVTPYAFEEAHIALSIARIKRQADTNFNFSLVKLSDSTKGINNALPSDYYLK